MDLPWRARLSGRGVCRKILSSSVRDHPKADVVEDTRYFEIAIIRRGKILLRFVCLSLQSVGYIVRWKAPRDSLISVSLAFYGGRI